MLKQLMRRLVASTATLLLATGMVTQVPVAVADDTELYSQRFAAGVSGRPKVLVIVDDSGSMDAVIQGSRPVYDPGATYVSKAPAGRIYWSTTGSPPDLDDPDEADQWFDASKNRCAESYSPLADLGQYSNNARRWRSANGQWVTETVTVCTFWFIVCWSSEQVTQTYWSGTEAGWTGLSDSVHSPVHVECLQDVVQNNNVNGTGQSDGYPRAASAPDTADADAYTTSVAQSNVNWGTTAYTFYTSHYMDWWNDTTIVTADKDYLQIAQEVIEGIVRTNTGIDFGLATFNDNYNGDGDPFGGTDDGGRILQRIIPNMTENDRDNLVTTLWGLDHEGATPLCESMYEAYRYFTGLSVFYGDSIDPDDVPTRDLLAESGGDYIAALSECTNSYVILLTDGLPTGDNDADGLVLNLTGENACRNYSGDGFVISSCLPNLTNYMALNDLDGDSSNNVQNIQTAVIGFNVPGYATTLLTDTATLRDTDGNKAYYFAEDAGQLAESFQAILLGILSEEATFTSPAVAVDSFSRTQSREELFYTMFEPRGTSDWYGNIKKMKIAKDANDELRVVDSLGNPAVDPSGGFLDSARSFWSTVNDGPKVASGGVGGVLRTMLNTGGTTTRNLLTNTVDVGLALAPFTSANVTPAAYGLTDPLELYSIFQVSDQDEFLSTLQWAWGWDVDDLDNDTVLLEARNWIMGDILHSKPLVINYGARGTFTQDDPDLRIVVGTNSGMLHMFGNDNGEEDWAFFPKELAPVLAKRRKNTTGGANVYGIDSPPVVYTLDRNLDGTLDHTDGDRVHLYFGLRRGGNMIYALDISNPDAPKYMWLVSPARTGYAEMGQTWSVPKVTSIPGYNYTSSALDGFPKPVLVVGGGYDPRKDDHDSLADTGEQDLAGRGIFVIDALTGELVWSVTPAVDSATNMQETGLVHSIAAPVTVVDFNGDGRSDRIYASDTGGQVWRVDMPGNTLPTSAQDEWFITKVFVAYNADDVARTKATDRRFFNAPDVVRTEYDGKPVDAILIGSGDRTNPIHKDNPLDSSDPSVDNEFYMIRDEQVTPYTDAYDASACNGTPPSDDFRCNLPLYPKNLYDVTENFIQDGDATQIAQAQLDLAAANGWRFPLEDNGEKSLSRSITINGAVYFTTFSPVIPQVSCGFASGNGRLYVVNLLDASAVLDLNGSGDADGDGDVDVDDTDKTDRYGSFFRELADTPAPYVDENGEISILGPQGDGGDDGAFVRPLSTGMTLNTPFGTYWLREQY